MTTKQMYKLWVKKATEDIKNLPPMEVKYTVSGVPVYGAVACQVTRPRGGRKGARISA